MRILLTIILLSIIGPAAWAQQAPTPSTSQEIETQIADVGCRAERQAAATTIANLQKQVNELQQQLAKAKHNGDKKSP